MAELDASELRQGWRTAVGCMIAASIGTIGFYAYTSGVFVPTLVADAGFTREQLSLANFVLSCTVAALAPFAGAAMDRFGPLKIIAIAVVGEAIAFALFSTIPPVFAYYLGAILLLALLGVGTTPPGFSRIITGRFDRSRGTALGIAISGLGLMAIFGPIIANDLIESFGWRTGYLVVSATVLVLGGAGLLLVASDRQGREAALRPAQRRSEETEAPGGWSGLKRPLFWVFLVAFLLPGLFGGGYLFHLVSILRERGFDPGEAARIQSLVGVAVLVGRLSSGVAMDRFFAPYVAAVAFSISGLGCLLLLSDTPWVIGAAALGIGLTIGAELDIMAYTISRYFGVQNFGRLYGLAYGGLIVCSGFSPMLITLVEGQGGYITALIVSAIGTAAGGLILAFAPRYPGEPARRVRRQAAAQGATSA